MNLKSAIQDIASQLGKKKQTLSVAESCTGGLLSAHITTLPGVSSVYLGGVISYANSVKTSLLNVQESTIKKHGAVSRETALEMASGARLGLSSDWSVAITGIAGPSGGTPEKPVGTVCFALVGPEFEETFQEFFKGDREQIQKSAVEYALKILSAALK